jgi:uncharacterized membrane protein YfcA
MVVGLWLAALLAGFFMGLSGVGTGSLLTPLLVVLGAPLPTAVGTVLAAGVPLRWAATAGRRGDRHPVARPRAAEGAAPRSGDPAPARRPSRRGAPRPGPQGEPLRALVATGAPCAAAGALLLHLLAPAFPEAGRRILAATLVAAGQVAVLLDAFAPGGGMARAGPDHPGRRSSVRKPVVGLLPTLGAACGLLVGLTSVGSGSFLGPALLLDRRLTPRKRAAVQAAAGWAMVAAAAAVHTALGDVDWHRLFVLLPGGLPGFWLGRRWAGHAAGPATRAVASGLALLAGVHLLT